MKEKKRRIHIVLAPENYEKIRTHAFTERTSVSGAIRKLIVDIKQRVK